MRKEVIVVTTIQDVRGAADAVLKSLAESGVAEITVKHYEVVYIELIEYLENTGAASTLDEAECVSFINEKAGTSLTRLYDPTNSSPARRRRRPLAVLLKMLERGEVDLKAKMSSREWECPPGYSQALEGYIAECVERGNAPATLEAKSWNLRRFIDYLATRGVPDLGSVVSGDVRDFVVRDRALKRRTVSATVGVLRDFFRWGRSCGERWGDLETGLPKVRVVKNECVPYAWSAEEVEALLAAIDRSSPIGKRDYAMVLLAVRLGLRFSDLRALSFDSVDWNARKIRIVQHKTGLPLELPLLDDVGWAIIDYVRTGRPQSASGKVFVRHLWPYDEVGTVATIDDRLYAYAKKAGIEFPAGRPHGIHSLRSSLARAMVASEAPLPVVAQTLGHASSKTTVLHYIRLDSEDLRLCCLDVEEIIGGGADV